MSAEKVFEILIQVGQNDPKFKWGETIRYTPSEVYEILKEWNNG